MHLLLPCRSLSMTDLLFVILLFLFVNQLLVFPIVRHLEKLDVIAIFFLNLVYDNFYRIMKSTNVFAELHSKGYFLVFNY